MRIERIESWRECVPLTRPYAISSGTTTDVELFFVRVVGDREIGLGSAAPVESITGETPEACAAALKDDRLELLADRDSRHLGAACATAAEILKGTPAALAAVDMALHDLFTRELGVPLVDLLGRRGGLLSTSITVGIQPTKEALEEVDEYLRQGFRHLKVKLGCSLEEDLERLRAIRAHAGRAVAIRVDANEGYSLEECLQFATCIGELDVELVEQPLPATSKRDLARLPAHLRARLALDESVHSAADALEYLREYDSCATYVVKLMKCGGITPAQAIAHIAEAGGRSLMWGCMDESAISIAAALHTAYASHATRYLDLDGSFDLARDPAEGGFRLVDGKLHLLDRPGLGVNLKSD